jgi:hypothetical protein
MLINNETKRLIAYKLIKLLGAESSLLFRKLNLDLTLYTLDFLSVEDLSSLAKTSKSNRALAGNNILWKKWTNTPCTVANVLESCASYIEDTYFTAKVKASSTLVDWYDSSIEQSRPRYQKPTADIEAPQEAKTYEEILSPLLANSFLNEGNTNSLVAAQADEMTNLPKTQQDLPAL